MIAEKNKYISEAAATEQLEQERRNAADVVLCTRDERCGVWGICIKEIINQYRKELLDVISEQEYSDMILAVEGIMMRLWQSETRTWC